jgi:hypothetical protein
MHTFIVANDQSSRIVRFAAFAALLMLIVAAAPGASVQAKLPWTAMPDGLMSAFMAASSQPFDVRTDGYYTRSGGLDITLQDGGLEAAGESIEWGLALTGFGRGEQISLLSGARITQLGDQLVYQRGMLTEWYRNTALGVEQGFTIQAAPYGAGLLTLRLDLSTDLVGLPTADGRGLSFASVDGHMLHYDHLRAWDADGVVLGASLLYSPGQIVLRVNDEGAAYPITIDPVVYAEQKVFASGSANDRFGYSVATSNDMVLVGAPADDVGANPDQGSAYIFTRGGASWKQQRLNASDGAAFNNFGYAVALSGDVALVGAPNSSIGANTNQGAAYIFTRSGTTWTQQAKLVASNGAANDQFGYSVALSGNTALVGAYHDDVGANPDQGSAYVFVQSGTVWSQQIQLTASAGAAEDYFGISVALSGSTALVGAYGDDVGANVDQGSAYIFTRSGTTWSQQGKPLVASGGAGGDFFGVSVALERDTALIGAHHDNDSRGSAYIFTRSRASWTQQGKPLTASDGAPGDRFGYSVALSHGTALVGAPFDDNHQGSAYVFTSSLWGWSQQAKLTASDGVAPDTFGISVAIADDTALVGASSDDIGTNVDQGSAYVFTRKETSWYQRWQLLASDGEAGDLFGHSVALQGDMALIGVPNDTVGSNASQGSAYFFVRSGTMWDQQGMLVAPDGEAGDAFGISVAFSGNTALVGASGDDVGANPDQGSAYIFVWNGTTWGQQGKLTALDGAMYDHFGGSVALSGDTALVGTPFDNIDANLGQGSAYVFLRSGAAWSQQTKLIAPDGEAGDGFGLSVALASDLALVGAPYDAIDANLEQGSAYVFPGSGASWGQPVKLTASDGAAHDQFGYSVALSGNTALVGAHQDTIGTNTFQGSAYAFTRSGAAWSQQGKLTASDGADGDHFGASVALVGDTALVGAYDVGYAGGAAYLFTRSGSTWAQQVRIDASDDLWIDCFGVSVALSGDAILIGADYGDITFSFHQGTAYFYKVSGLP